MSKLRSVLRELAEADIDRGYVVDALVHLIEISGLADAAADVLELRFRGELAEYRKAVEEESVKENEPTPCSQCYVSGYNPYTTAEDNCPECGGTGYRRKL